MEGLEAGSVVAARGDRLGAEQVGVWGGHRAKEPEIREQWTPRSRSAESGAVGV